jgi:hypothetical protein
VTPAPRYQWEILPEPNPDRTRVGPGGEADTEQEALRALGDALASQQAGFGVLYELGAGEDRRELLRIPVEPPPPKPPAW